MYFDIANKFIIIHKLIILKASCFCCAGLYCAVRTIKMIDFNLTMQNPICALDQSISFVSFRLRAPRMVSDKLKKCMPS